MKTLLFFVLFSGLTFAQSKDLSKKQAYQMFLKSNVSKALKLNKTDFERIFKIGIDRKSVILNTVTKKELNYIENYYCCSKFDDKEMIITESSKEIKDKMKTFPL
ncbi:hypothetical protein [Elizabethkingia meningoseptica]|uniref:hypothetical protein n=1 Tax=Elizabethkingia meningoseptica TaxID=238 RepID=UPI003891BCDF